MATQLRNIVRFTAVAPATPTLLPHNLNLNSIGLIPDILIQSRGDFTVTSDATNITVTNNSASAAAIDVFVVHWHTFDRVFGNAAITALTPAPFNVVSGGGAVGALLNVQQTFTAGQAVAQVTLAAAVNVEVAGSLSNNFDLELDVANVELDNPIDVVEGMTINIAVRQDVVGGRVLTFGSAYRFDAANVPALPVGASDEFLISCYVRVAVAGVATVMICARTGAAT